MGSQPLRSTAPSSPHDDEQRVRAFTQAMDDARDRHRHGLLVRSDPSFAAGWIAALTHLESRYAELLKRPR